MTMSIYGGAQIHGRLEKHFCILFLYTNNTSFINVLGSFSPGNWVFIKKISVSTNYPIYIFMTYSTLNQDQVQNCSD
jgi:hypothetical protein